MSAVTSTSSASFTKANKTRHISLAMTAALLAGLSAGAVFAQSASDTQSAPATETVQPAQQPAEAPATPSAPAIQPAPPSAAAPEQPAAAQPAPAQSAPAAGNPAPAAEGVAPQPTQIEQPAPTNTTAAPNEVSTPIEPVSTEPASAEHRADIPHNLSPWGMFMAAALVVQIVMVGLALASVATWTVWLVKSIELAMGKAKVRGLLRALRGATSLDGVLRALPAGRTDPAATLVDTPPHEAFAKRRGVCQDFAQIMISGLRAAGLPEAALVPGELRTRNLSADPASSGPAERDPSGIGR